MFICLMIFQSYSLFNFPMEKPLKLCLPSSLQEESIL